MGSIPIGGFFGKAQRLSMIRNSVEETKLEISEGFAIPFLVFILSRVIQEKRDCSLGGFFEKSFSKKSKELGQR